jgi:phytoene dehydrogenase-like protein
MQQRYDVIIVGAGHNGLVAAGYLARAGRRVLVLERRDVAGGAAVTEEPVPGFRFDTGAHRLGWVPERIAADLGLARHGLQVLPSDPAMVALQPGGEALVLWRSPARTAAALRRFSPGDAERWPSFVGWLGRLTRLLRRVFLAPAPRPTSSRPGDLLSLLDLGLHLRLLGREEMLELMRVLSMPVADFLDEWFAHPVLKGALAAAGVRGLAQGPRSGGTAYLLLHGWAGSRPDSFETGIWVQGGMGNLGASLVAAARQRGVEIRLGAGVQQILVREGRAVGVVLGSGEEIEAGQVVSNADPRSTFLGLLDPVHLDVEFLRQVRNIKLRGVVAKVNLALSELPRFAGLPGEEQVWGGPFVISPSLDYLERAYLDAKYGRVSRWPILEVQVPSTIDRSLAPPGQHVASILVQYVPYHRRDVPWDAAQGEVLGDAVIRTLGEYAPNLEPALLHRQVRTPANLEATFGLAEGNIYHGEMTLDQVLFLRPVPGWAWYRTPIDGLYLCGAGTHPGGGVTGAPGYNAARQILRDGRRA